MGLWSYSVRSCGVEPGDGDGDGTAIGQALTPGRVRGIRRSRATGRAGAAACGDQAPRLFEMRCEYGSVSSGLFRSICDCRC